ncbi:MAG: LmeA family phospholipid-binding protein [Candidatus Aquicultor sp.]
MRRIPVITIAIPIIIVLGILVAIVVPSLANTIIQSAVIDTLKHDYGLDECAYVRVDSTTLMLLSGKVSQVYVECSKGDFNGLKAKSLTIFVRDIRFDLKAPVLKKKVAVTKIGKANARIVFGENDINHYISSAYPDLSAWKIRLKPEGITAKVDIEMLGGLEVTFKPRIKGDYLVIEPIDAKFTKLSKWGAVNARNWVREIPLNIPVNNLPFGMRITKILVQDNQMVVTAEN